MLAEGGLVLSKLVLIVLVTDGASDSETTVFEVLKSDVGSNVA